MMILLLRTHVGTKLGSHLNNYGGVGGPFGMGQIIVISTSNISIFNVVGRHSTNTVPT